MGHSLVSFSPSWPFDLGADLGAATYLVHPVVMQVCYFSVIERFRYSAFTVASWFASNLVSLLCSM
jgi:hypothetical protein